MPNATRFHHCREANSRRHCEHSSDQKGRREGQNLPQVKPVSGSEGTNQSKETKAHSHMDSVFNHFKQVKDSLQIVILLPGHPLITIDAFSFPSKMDTAPVAHAMSLPNLRERLSPKCGIARQPFPVLSIRGTHPNTYGLGGSALSPGRRPAEGDTSISTKQLVPVDRMLKSEELTAYPFSDVF